MCNPMICFPYTLVVWHDKCYALLRGLNIIVQSINQLNYTLLHTILENVSSTSFIQIIMC